MFFMANYRANGRKTSESALLQWTQCTSEGEIQRYDAKSRGNKWHQVVHRESSVDEKKAIKKEISLIYCFKNTCYFLPVKIRSINSTNYILFLLLKL